MSLSQKARALGVAVLLGIGVAHSAEAAESASDARVLFEVGVKAYERGQFRTAVIAFQEAYRLTQRPGLLFSLGQALRRSYEESHAPRELQDAIRYYQRYLAAPHEGEHRKEAAAWVEQLSKLPDARVPVAPPAAPPAEAQLVMAVNVPSATLTLNGRPVPALPHAAEVPPGVHRLVATAPGYTTVEREVSVTEGAVLSLNLELRRLTSRLEVSGEAGAEVFLDGRRVGVLPLPALEASPGRHWVEVRAPGHFTMRRAVSLEPDESQRLSLMAPPTTRRIASWVLVGGGAGALLTGGVIGYFALNQQAKARDLQTQPGARAAFDDAIATRDSLRLGAAISGGVGVAALASGIISIVTEGHGPVRTVGAMATSGGDARSGPFIGVNAAGVF